MAPVWASQPFKAIYTIFFLLKAPVQLTLLFAFYLRKSLRPLPEWDVKNNLVVAAMRMYFQYTVATRSPYILYTDLKTAKERLEQIEPPATYLFTGALAPTQDVKPAPVQAVWYPSQLAQDAADLKKQKVVLHFPGGAFVLAFSHQMHGTVVADSMAKHMKATRTVWAQYRLASSPETSFPAAIQDAFTFYHHIVSSGVDPKNIILSGDSAGGNVVLALMRYLESSKTQTPLPGGAVVFSPWVDVTYQAEESFEQTRNSGCDMLTRGVLRWGLDAYRPEGRELSDEAEATLSPMSHPFKTSIPTFIHAGAAEVLHDSIQTFAGEMAQVNGDRVQFRSTPLAPHDLLLSHEGFGLTAEFEAFAEEACTFFEERRD